MPPNVSSVRDNGRLAPLDLYEMYDCTFSIFGYLGFPPPATRTKNDLHVEVYNFCIVDIVRKLAMRPVSSSNCRHQREVDIAINLICGDDVIGPTSSNGYLTPTKVSYGALPTFIVELSAFLSQKQEQSVVLC